MDAASLWEKILNVYKTHITKQFYESFFSSIEPVTVRKNKLILLAPNYFIKEVIENNHLNTLHNIAKDVSSTSYEIQIILDLEEITDMYLDSDSDNGKDIRSYSLNPKYTFDTFVIGNSNRFAHAACVAVAESPAKAYNPLFIYGGVGLGKTHLMHAIGHYIVSNNKISKILYLSSETFSNALINSIKDDKNEAFRNKYRNVDVILVDDIQFIAGKERTQEEFFHTFNALHDANKQIIISSDRTPKEIPTLEDRLRSRFEMGLIADIQPPDFETRIAILRKKAQVENRDIPNEVMVHIAKNIKSNIRELEGALVRVIAYSDLTKEEITYELACEALKDIFQSSANNELNSLVIKEKVAQIFSVKMEDFQSKKRTRAIAYPRQIAMYLCRELTDMSLPKIGEEFGGRDHTTVIHACDKVASDIEKDEDIKNKINRIITDLKN